MSRNEYVISEMELAVKDICSKCTYPIFYNDHKNKPDQVATALAIDVGNTVYLITAAHAIKGRDNKVVKFSIGTKRGIVIVEGRYIVTEVNPSTGIDLYDIALVALSQDFVAKYDLSFLSEKNICPWEFLETDFFAFVFGYPSSRNKQTKSLRGSTFNTFQYAYAGKVVEDLAVFSRHNRSDIIHTCMTYGKNPLSNKPIYPKGCSGGGLWVIDKTGNVYLDSIFIEYFSQTDMAFGTKLIQVLKLLSQNDKSSGSLDEQQLT